MAYSSDGNLVSASLCSSLFTGGLTSTAFGMDIYVGSPFGPNWFETASPFILIELAMFLIPGMIFGFFAVWPATFALAHLAIGFEQRLPVMHGWPAWLGLGAIAGGPLLLLYSFILNLGQALLLNLLATGAICGTVCAALCRLLIKRDVVDAAIGTDSEAS